ncbi:MAG: thiamine-phosphate pyrophosphorylase [Methanosaeta sp. NSM2]|nr:MAG: thiamine-phosphate pyrophosphorylase [Methanosaeta sp. NSM2]
MKGYYFITDSNLSRAGNRSDVLAAVSCGVNVVQYRNKNAETREMYREALDLSQICRDAGSLFLVNDRLDVALAVEADGVHVGQADMPCPKARKLLGRNKIIGVTGHNLAEALQAEKEDYLGVSPIFETATKKDAGRPAGIRLIEEIRSQVSLPLIAIGGIDHTNAPQVVRAGADGLCAISCVVAQEDVGGRIRRFQELFEGL